MSACHTRGQWLDEWRSMPLRLKCTGTRLDDWRSMPQRLKSAEIRLDDWRSMPLRLKCTGTRLDDWRSMPQRLKSAEIRLDDWRSTPLRLKSTGATFRRAIARLQQRSAHAPLRALIETVQSTGQHSTGTHQGIKDGELQGHIPEPCPQDSPEFWWWLENQHQIQCQFQFWIVPEGPKTRTMHNSPIHRRIPQNIHERVFGTHARLLCPPLPLAVPLAARLAFRGHQRRYRQEVPTSEASFLPTA